MFPQSWQCGMGSGSGGGESVFVVVVEIITLYLVQNGAHLATTGYVAPSPNHVQHNVHEQSVSQCIRSPCVCVCVRIQYRLQTRSNHRYNGMFECSPFPPNGDVRLPKTGEQCQKRKEGVHHHRMSPRCSKKKKRMKSIQSQRERIQKPSKQREPKRVLYPNSANSQQIETTMPQPMSHRTPKKTKPTPQWTA